MPAFIGLRSMLCECHRSQTEASLARLLERCFDKLTRMRIYGGKPFETVTIGDTANEKVALAFWGSHISVYFHKGRERGANEFQTHWVMRSQPSLMVVAFCCNFAFSSCHSNLVRRPGKTL